MAASPGRVLHVIHGLTVGGAEIDLLHKARWLVQNRSYTMTVCCLMRRGSLAGEFEAAGIEVRGPFMAGRYDPRGVSRLGEVLREPWHILHSHIHQASLVAAVARARPGHRSRIPWLVGEHRMATAWRAPAILAKRILSRSASGFLVPTRAAADSYVRRGLSRDRIQVSPNAVDIERFSQETRSRYRDPARQELGLSPTDFVLGTACRLEAVKDLPTLFEAAGDLPVTLLVAGEGTERLALERLIASRGWTDRIRLLGIRSDLPRFLAALDLFVLSSRSESFALAVVEAMALGLPVIATEVGGIPEVTGDGRGANLVPPQDPSVLRDAIEGLRGDPERMRQLGTAGVEVAKTYSVPRAARALDRIYASFLDGSTARQA